MSGRSIYPGRGKERAERSSLLDETPSVLHLPDGPEAGLRPGGPRARGSRIVRTNNDTDFPRASTRRGMRNRSTARERCAEKPARGSSGPFSTTPTRPFPICVARRGRWAPPGVVEYPPHHLSPSRRYTVSLLPRERLRLHDFGEERLPAQGQRYVLRSGRTDPSSGDGARLRPGTVGIPASGTPGNPTTRHTNFRGRDAWVSLPTREMSVAPFRTDNRWKGPPHA